MTTPVKDRPLWRTVDVRVEDLAEGDVTRNRYGKWDVVVDTKKIDDHYYEVDFEVGGKISMRSVALVKVQAVKPS